MKVTWKAPFAPRHPRTLISENLFTWVILLFQLCRLSFSWAVCPLMCLFEVTNRIKVIHWINCKINDLHHRPAINGTNMFVDDNCFQGEGQIEVLKVCPTNQHYSARSPAHSNSTGIPKSGKLAAEITRQMCLLVYKKKWGQTVGSSEVHVLLLMFNIFALQYFSKCN